MTELTNFGLERSREQFPNVKFEPSAALLIGETLLLVLWADSKAAVGRGKSINECCDELLANIAAIVNRDCEPETFPVS
ncbi:MAG: hypothetical protein LBK58_04960 [Prevotellaceae bacterium]|nr:hypothetical protein [Prevotellaceae bacterium]